MSTFDITFKTDVPWEKVTKKVFNDITIIAHKSTIDMFSRIVKRTPVDSGRTRGNWQFQIGAPPKAILNTLDRSGGAAISRMVSDIRSWNPEIKAYIANNVPWILMLENGGYPSPPNKGAKTVRGYSKQAPKGMVKITIAEFSRVLKAAGRG